MKRFSETVKKASSDCSGGLRPSKFPCKNENSTLIERRYRYFSTTSSGFTLIELLTVIVIIITVASLIVGGSRYAWLKAKNSRAQAEIAAMENALETFKNDNGYYPYSTDNRTNASANSLLLYTALTEGPKVYFVFSEDQLKRGHPKGTIPVPISCPGGSTMASNVENVWIVDPFDNYYNYFHSCGSNLASQTNQATYDLWSYGPVGTNDDVGEVTNWKR